MFTPTKKLDQEPRYIGPNIFIHLIEIQHPWSRLSFLLRFLIRPPSSSSETLWRWRPVRAHHLRLAAYHHSPGVVETCPLPSSPPQHTPSYLFSPPFWVFAPPILLIKLRGSQDVVHGRQLHPSIGQSDVHCYLWLAASCRLAPSRSPLPPPTQELSLRAARPRQVCPLP